MAKFHVLTGKGTSFQIVAHADVPSGENSAGVSWADCVRGAGRNLTVMTVGSAPGKITQEEAEAIQSGQVLEVVFLWSGRSDATDEEKMDDMEEASERQAEDAMIRMKEQLKFFGLTRS